MSPGISLSLHWWRGIGPDIEPDLFLFRYRFGIFTVSVCKVCLLDRYRMLRETMVKRVEADEARANQLERGDIIARDQHGFLRVAKRAT